jgi:hypothetical protein
MEKVIVKTLLAVQPYVAHTYKSCIPDNRCCPYRGLVVIFQQCSTRAQACACTSKHVTICMCVYVYVYINARLFWQV